MNSIHHYISQTNIQQSYQALALQPANQASSFAENSTTPRLKINQNTVVSISSEAQERLAQEQKNIGQALAKQQQAKESEKNEKTQITETERLDQIIADIQEKIKAVQKELRALNGEKTEQAAAQRKLLNAQLASLNASLINVMGKKLEALES